MVAELTRLLAAQGLKIWFDEDELRPGVPWQQLLEAGIKASKSVAVVVGRDGLGPWENEEMQAALLLAVRDKRPVIPVLLPEAPRQPDLPMFLENRTWVDLRLGFTDDGLFKLIWGITGQKPDRIQRPQSPQCATAPEVHQDRRILFRYASRLLRVLQVVRRYRKAAFVVIASLVILLLSILWHPTRCRKLNPNYIPSRYVRSENNQRVIVFVHGIFGNAKDTWTCPTGAYWPELLQTDDAFKSYDIYVVGYETPYLGNSMTIDEVVGNLNSRLLNDEVFSSHGDVVFVCHSLGGLIVQRLLLNHRDYAVKVPFIYFYSTPETGSQLAALGRIFSSDPLLDQMFPGDRNAYLLNLENEWQAAGFQIHRYCAYEKKPMNGFLVVDRLSGTRNCKSSIAINEDHASIVKPCSQNHDSFIALRNAVREHTPPPSPSSNFISGFVSDQETGEPLPDVQITLPEAKLEFSTDRQGHFVVEFADRKVNSLLVIAQKPGYETYRTRATLGNTNLGFAMRRKR